MVAGEEEGRRRKRREDWFFRPSARSTHLASTQEDGPRRLDRCKGPRTTEKETKIDAARTNEFSSFLFPRSSKERVEFPFSLPSSYRNSPLSFPRVRRVCAAAVKWSIKAAAAAAAAATPSSAKSAITKGKRQGREREKINPPGDSAVVVVDFEGGRRGDRDA